MNLSSLLRNAAVIAAFSMAFVPTLARAQSDPRVEKFQQYLEHLNTNGKFIGSVAVSVDGSIIYQAQFGTITDDATPNQQQTPRAADAETQYRIGSITKTFTAVMILQLVEEGKLSLDTKLSEFFPDVKNANEITIEQLLRHRSGVGSITDDPTYPRWNTMPKTREQMREIIARQPVKFQPGEQTAYSNSNFVLLGFIIEDLTKQSYAEALKSRIVDRIGLKRTAFAVRADANENVALSFQRFDDRWKAHSETDPSIPHGAGSIMSTPSDLVVFIESLFAGKLIGKASLAKMTTLVDRLGLGIFRMPFADKNGFGHNGGIDGFQSTLGYFPEQNVAFALLSNGIDYTLNDVAIGILSIVFGGEAEMPSFKEAKVAEETLQRYEGVYATKMIPLKIHVRLADGQLTAQATGQSAFPLTPTSDVDFKFPPAGVVISFSESTQGKGFDVLRLLQAGQDIKFEKQ